MNLLEETKRVLEKHGYSLDDIEYIQGDDFGISLENFIEKANIDYDNGYGAQHIATDLVLIGSEFWMSRSEYDGAESWEWHEMPVIHNIVKHVESLGGSRYGWRTLTQINQEGEE